MESKHIKLGAHDGLHGIFYHLDEVQKWKHNEIFPPLYVEVSPTNMCNQRCFYCYVDHLGFKNISIPEDLIVKIFRDMGSFGVKCCEIQGTGEPLLNKGVPEAIVTGKKAGMDIVLVTNGSLLQEDILKKIMPCLSFLRISSLAHNHETYARLHGCPEEHFDKVLNAIKSAVRIREEQNLDTVIVATYLLFDFNIPYVYETAKLMKDIGVDVFKLWPTIDQGRNPKHNWKNDHYQLFKEKIEAIKELENDRFKVYLNVHNLDFYMKSKPQKKPYAACYGVEFESHIDADGRLYPCQFLWRQKEFCLGNLHEKSFSEIWMGHERIEKTNLFLKKMSTDKCNVFCCKQDSINKILWDLKNPPKHVNVI